VIWGETGTRNGATRLQLASVGWLWSRYAITELHDGDCKGADAQLYELAGAFGPEWKLDSIATELLASRFSPDGAPAWLARFTRL